MKEFYATFISLGAKLSEKWWDICKQCLVDSDVYSITISKGQLKAPVIQTISHSVHQSHSSAVLTATISPTSTRAPQWHTSTQTPHPLHFSASITGISIIKHIHYKYINTKLVICLRLLSHECSPT